MGRKETDAEAYARIAREQGDDDQDARERLLIDLIERGNDIEPEVGR
ncbi:hypothetical protein GCM10010174_69740 [Kutzneria viridogrisea]|uniref:Uncharacterized protein n=1 Tax=Kutzneria viridogrisea TaxID=47990 RepID=A0ABR6BAZ0_9PSEU|nr:hypothetical protein [Kutzneria viridogrisea]